MSICRQHDAELLVVSKTRTEKEIMELYKKGQRSFGENRAHELIIKASLLPTDIKWHLIGHLQTNKIRSIIPYVHCIQSLDSLKLWQKLNEEATEANVTVNALLQIKIASEETKYGWDYEELICTLHDNSHHELSHVSIQGVMGMASLTSDKEQIREEFRKLRKGFDVIKKDFFNDHPDFNTVSMGMSADYSIALEEGSTMIRIGSLLFPQA